MIDLHSHILPEVDDGASSLEMALELLLQYADQGVQAVACTPHIGPQQLMSTAALAEFRQAISWQLNRLQELALEKKLAIHLHSGCELILCSELIERLQEKDHALALGQSSYLLVELPRWLSGGLRMLDHLLFALQMCGYMPILAHPERSMGQPEVLVHLQTWVEQDRLLLQVNTSSLIDDPAWPSDRARRYRRRRQYVDQLLERGLVHVVASDAHDPVNRPPQNRQAYDGLAERLGTETADLLMRENPALILADQPVIRLKQGLLQA